MKFILAFSICSAITGYCNTTMTIDKQFNTWSECVIGGSQLTIEYAKRNRSIKIRDTRVKRI